jgi:hypothetical protein
MFEEVYALPALPSNKKNSSVRHSSYNKGPNLAFFSFTENPSNSLFTLEFPKTHITFSSYNMSKTTMTDFSTAWLNVHIVDKC